MCFASAELRNDPILKISSGDTAVVLAALARWGTAALSRFNGMWALALLDRAGDFAGKRFPRLHITGSDPARETRLFERCANGIGYGFVLSRMGDENGMRHYMQCTR